MSMLKGQNGQTLQLIELQSRRVNQQGKKFYCISTWFPLPSYNGAKTFDLTIHNIMPFLSKPKYETLLQKGDSVKTHIVLSQMVWENKLDSLSYSFSEKEKTFIILALTKTSFILILVQMVFLINKPVLFDILRSHSHLLFASTIEL